MLQNSHADIRKLRKQTGTPTIHGNKFWKSTFLLIDYLNEFPPDHGARVLEIGCGWGIAGIYCAKTFNAYVTSLDADEAVFPYLQHHADINEVNVTPLKRRYEQVRKQDLSAFDLVIASDICFWDEMSKPLLGLVRRAKQVGTVRVVMTDPGREPFQKVGKECENSMGAIFDDWLSHAPYEAHGLVMDLNPKALQF